MKLYSRRKRCLAYIGISLGEPMKVSLLAVIFGFVSLSPALANSDIICVQEFLKKTAFDPGLVDGKWGKGTGVAINSLFDQVGLNKKGQEVTVEQANEICAVLKSDKYKEILELGQFKIFSIDIK